MIRWLVCSAADHPDLAQARAPDGLLSEAERTRFMALRTDKRRRDWLLGRWTAKHLLQSALMEGLGTRLPLETLTVGSEPDGSPVVTLSGGGRFGALLPDGRLPIRLSISHSRDRALGALYAPDARGQGGEGTPWNIGADIERVEARSWQFVEDYFTRDEVAYVRLASDDERDRLVTGIWSAKEAVLKALRLGLTVDTRRVTCRIAPVRYPPNAWTPFDVECAADLPRDNAGRVPVLTGWWRAMDDFVLTLAMLAEVNPC